MLDIEIIKRLEAAVGASFPHVLRDGRCEELSLSTDDHLYHGLIRDKPAAIKRDILRLVCQLTGLRRLNLRRNVLRELPPEFSRLGELEHLVLGSNYLGCIPDALRGCRRLRSLHFGNNDLTDLPPWLGELDQLEYLALHKNIRLKSLVHLRGLTRLKNLNLFLLNLLTLPEVLYELTNLSTLTLWNVSNFPAGLECFPAMEYFTLSGSLRARALPPGFTRLARLRMTRLHQNSLEALPEDLGSLQELEQISVYQNQLTALPESMATLQRLTKVNLGWNQFRQLPAWLSQLEHLHWLGVFENPLEVPVRLPHRSGLQVVSEWPFSSSRP